MWKRRLFKPILRYYSTYNSNSSVADVKICVVGGGPAGFYAAQQVVKLLPSAKIDIYERLPVPFGLVRFGVAPDHPEVKNVINTFTKTANHPNVHFYGNLALGKDYTLSDLQNAYHAVILSYGAEEDKCLGVSGEELSNVVAARQFVGWYNGLPCDRDLNVNLNCESAVVIGQGNVAVDVARILLSPIDELKKTDITEYALERLSRSKVRHVSLVGRRGPMQVAFTIKELRELVNLPSVQTRFQKEDFKDIPQLIPSLGRPRKRLTELLYKSAMEDRGPQSRTLEMVFKRSPIRLLGDEQVEGVELAVNRLEGDSWENERAVATDEVDVKNCGLLLRSIGYKSVQADASLPFNHKTGIALNKDGFVSNGIYCCGWLSSGPVGVILSTMSNAFATGQLVCQHISSGILDVKESKPASKEILRKAKANGTQVVTFEDWERINQEEERRGKEKGKPREKITSVEEMLNVAKSES